MRTQGTGWRKEKKQVPHPAEGAGIRDDNFFEDAFYGRGRDSSRTSRDGAEILRCAQNDKLLMVDWGEEGGARHGRRALQEAKPGLRG